VDNGDCYQDGHSVITSQQQQHGRRGIGLGLQL
jgi:hypothetical protein